MNKYTYPSHRFTGAPFQFDMNGCKKSEPIHANAIAGPTNSSASAIPVLLSWSVTGILMAVFHTVIQQ